MGKKLIYVIIIILLFLALNIFARFLYAQSWFSDVRFTNEIDPVAIINIILSTIVAIWLGLYITKKLAADRFQKEFLIDDIKEIEEKAKIIEDSLQSSSIELQIIINHLHNFKNSLDRFSTTIDIFEIKSICSDGLEYNFKELYNKTTDTDGDRFPIDESIRIEINKIFSSIISETRHMVYTINKG